MSDFHCITSGCAEVVYQEYLPAVVRWRYPGEEWQEIEADDFNLEENDRGFEGGQCCHLRYRIIAPLQYVDYARPNQVRFTSRYQRDTRPNGKIIAFEPDNTKKRENGISTSWVIYYEDCNGTVRKFDLSTNSTRAGWLDSTAHIESITVIGEGEDNCDVDECVFTITNQGVEVFTETRDVCPEVEKLPCRLSDQIKSVRWKKVPFIQKGLVINKAFDQEFYGIGDAKLPFLRTTKLPPECLNIYSSFITSGTDYPDDGIPIPGLNPWRLIKQICSAPGCPPPKYGFVCNDECLDCENCPENTCGVECGDHICCYNSSGQSVKQISIAAYCGTPGIETEFFDTRGLNE